MHAFILLASLYILYSGGGALLAQDESAARYSLKQDQPHVGTNIKRSVATSDDIPFNKRYSELTTEQRAVIKAQYEALGPDDEPPYPIDGLGPVYKLIATAQHKLRVSGGLTVAVDVDSVGNAVSVSVLQAADADMAKAVASVLLLQKYKPALCNGKPCAMQFPFRMTFKTR